MARYRQICHGEMKITVLGLKCDRRSRCTIIWVHIAIFIFNVDIIIIIVITVVCIIYSMWYYGAIYIDGVKQIRMSLSSKIADYNLVATSDYAQHSCIYNILTRTYDILYITDGPLRIGLVDFLYHLYSRRYNLFYIFLFSAATAMLL